MSRYARMATASVPVTEALNEGQVKNNAGGFVFQLDDWARLERFLILGSDSNTYYQTAPKLTRQNSKCVERCYTLDPVRTASTISNVSVEGRAAKNDAAIFALALGAVHVDVRARQAALAELHTVCRTATHLFQFVDTVRALGRGWGRSLKRAVANWYERRPAHAIAYQAIKYRSRENYTHKRMLQTAHPSAAHPATEQVYRWICGKVKPDDDATQMPKLIIAHEAAMAQTDVKGVLRVLEKQMLPWEAIPTQFLNEPDVWRLMLPDMGLTAMLRELARMTQIGLLKPFAPELRVVTERLTDEGQLKEARIHPFNLLVAKQVYVGGKSFRGGRSWTPVPQIADALEKAFYASFKTIRPSNKRTLIGLDVSGSMGSLLMGSPLSVAAGAAAMCMATARTEPSYHIFGFASTFKNLGINSSDSLEAVLRKTTDHNFGGTDCSLPMRYALTCDLDVDVFVVYTDSETWAGTHAVEELKRYRQRRGIAAKLVVVGMTSTGFTIADPNDAGMLDVVGFDSAAPSLIADFARR